MVNARNFVMGLNDPAFHGFFYVSIVSRRFNYYPVFGGNWSGDRILNRSAISDIAFSFKNFRYWYVDPVRFNFLSLLFDWKGGKNG